MRCTCSCRPSRRARALRRRWRTPTRTRTQTPTATFSAPMRRSTSRSARRTSWKRFQTLAPSRRRPRTPRGVSPVAPRSEWPRSGTPPTSGSTLATRRELAARMVATSSWRSSPPRSSLRTSRLRMSKTGGTRCRSCLSRRASTRWISRLGGRTRTARRSGEVRSRSQCDRRRRSSSSAPRGTKRSRESARRPTQRGPSATCSIPAAWTSTTRAASSL
mmetsp:Transcript_48316/g.138964  ORF Transcript_48316/g.138964 Transcript_48316/m.138964 type:complete len:218 (+) Transcript_48316:280-933(+)